MHYKIFGKNSTESRLKYGYPPAQEKQFKIFHIHINEKPSVKTSILILRHNYPTKQLRRRKTENSISSHHIVQYSLRLLKIQTVKKTNKSLTTHISSPVDIIL